MKEEIIVWHLLSNRWNSAITEYAISAIKALNLVGIKNVFSPLTGSPAFIRAEEYSFNIAPVKSYQLTSFLKLYQLYKKINPDIIISYGGPESVLAMLMCKLSGRNVAKCIRFKGHDFRQDHRFGHRLRDLNDRYMHKIILPSNAVANRSTTSVKSKSVIIPLGIAGHGFLSVDCKAIRDSNAEKNRPELLIFGRLDPVKGHREFLKIFACLLKKWPQYLQKYDVIVEKPILHIVGLEKNITVKDIDIERQRLGIPSDCIAFTASYVTDVPALMASASLGIISSIGSEVICRVAEEFLMCGTPIFTSGVGGLAEVNLDDCFRQAGVFSSYCYSGLDADDASDLLANAIINRLQESSDVSMERATWARRKYSLEQMAAAIKAVF
ncbi:MAG: glycosyltransferase family 4 protein [Bdellovibrionota bacterium]